MALTVSQQPQAYTPAYNSQIFTALSDQVAVSDFKYILTVQVNGDTIETYNILPRPDNYMVHDVMEWVKNYITRDYFDPFSSYGLANGKAANVQVKVKEYYTGAIQSTTTINYVVWDACLTDDEFLTFDYEDYLGTSLAILPLSDIANVDSRLTVLNGDSFLHFFKGTATEIEVIISDENGTLIDSGTTAITTAYTGIHYFKYGVSTVTGLGHTVEDGWSIEVNIKNTIGTILYTETKTFKSICTKYKEYGLYYLTREGKMDYMNFEMISINSVAKTDESVRLNPAKLISGVYSRNSYDSDVNTVATETTKKVILNTYWITPSQSEQLQDLFDSPIVYLKDFSANTYRAVTIKETNYVIGSGYTDPLIPLTLAVEYTSKETRQRGL